MHTTTLRDTHIFSNRYYWKKTITSKFMKNHQKMLQSLTIYTVSNHYYWKRTITGKFMKKAAL